MTTHMSMAERFLADNDMIDEPPVECRFKENFSEARKAMIQAKKLPAMIGGFISAPCSVSHAHYTVGYYSDKSILIWSVNDGYLVLDGNQTYYRDLVEHLARCLGLFTKERRAEMVGGQDKWIDGIHWAADGSFLGF